MKSSYFDPLTINNNLNKQWDLTIISESDEQRAVFAKEFLSNRTDNLISLEEKFNTGLFSYTAMYRHKNNLEKGIFNFYSWF